MTSRVGHDDVQRHGVGARRRHVSGEVGQLHFDGSLYRRRILGLGHRPQCVGTVALDGCRRHAVEAHHAVCETGATTVGDRASCREVHTGDEFTGSAAVDGDEAVGSGPVDVTFKDTAPTPVDGTKPARAVICTCSSYLPLTCCFATTRNESRLWPARVSKTRPRADRGVVRRRCARRRKNDRRYCHRDDLDADPLIAGQVGDRHDNRVRAGRQRDERCH